MEHSSVDRISSLPNDVRELILMSLPLRDAAKCSILSTTWRNLWTYLPTLVIDETFGDAIKPRRSNDYRSDVVERLIMLDVCKVLMIHRGPLKDLSLSIGMLGDQVDQVLRFLPIKTIENLTIVSDPFTDFSKTVLESFSQLKTLRLSSCTFPFSTVSFEGFDRLTVLQLRNISFDGTAQPQLIFRCPLLTTLIVERFLSLIDPSILVEAPRLECLYLFSHFSHLVLNGTSLLKTLTVHKILSETSSIQLGEVFGTVETLSIGICIISEYISHREQWMKLRQLSLVEIEDRDLHTRNNVLAVVRMIMNSPNLQRLEIQLDDAYAYNDGYWCPDDEAVDITELRDVASEYEQIRLLTKVEVKRIRGTENEMTLISWLLNSIPALDQMKIKLSTGLSKDESLSVVGQLNKLQSPSSKADIIIS